MNKSKLALAVCCFAVAGLAGCGSDQTAAAPPPPAPAPVAAAPPAPAPSPAPSAKPMTAQQSRVASAQTALNSNGAQLDVDGRMGRKTVAALKAYQKQHHLKVTGKLDSATVKALGV